uniref:(California timema) hypothetical protein n=1 Tax=Timema californicum TaxID=61474 RepID=A0A7R9IX14_TIMCA|nr:unnamed protein product [Timema californicum]
MDDASKPTHVSSVLATGCDMNASVATSIRNKGERICRCDLKMLTTAWPQTFHRLPGKSCLKVHQAIHSGERNHMCDLCGQTFTYAFTLTSHMSTHTGHKPHHCGKCGKTFSQKGTFNRHMLVHTGEKLRMMRWKESRASLTSLEATSSGDTSPASWDISLVSNGFDFSSLAKHGVSVSGGSASVTDTLLSGISGGGGLGIRSDTFTASYINHWAAVKVPIITILGPRPFHKPANPNFFAASIAVTPFSWLSLDTTVSAG